MRNSRAASPPRFHHPRLTTMSSSATHPPWPTPNHSSRQPPPPTRVEKARQEFREAIALRIPDRERVLQAWKKIVVEKGIDSLTDEELTQVLFLQRTQGTRAREETAATVRETYNVIRRSGRRPSAEMLRHVAVAYAKAGSMTGVQEVAKEAMSELPGRRLADSDVLELMAKAYSDAADALPIFDELDKMLESGSNINRVFLLYDTFAHALYLAAVRSNPRAFKKGIALVNKHRIPMRPKIYEARIQFLVVVSGKVDVARKLLNEARMKNFNLHVSAYNHVLKGLIKTGRYDDIAGFFDQMRKSEITANGITYELLLTMYDPHFGQINPVAAVKTFEAMRAKGIASRPSHHIALARAVQYVITASDSEGLVALLLGSAITPNEELLNGIRDGFAALRDYTSAWKVSDIYLSLSAYHRKDLPIRRSWALRHLEMLVHSGRGGEWRTAWGEISRHGTPIDTEMCNVILAHYKGDRSVEAASTARELFDRMRSIGALFSIATLENMLLTVWDPEKDAALNSEALFYVEACVEILYGDTARGIQDGQPIAKALKVFGVGKVLRGVPKLPKDARVTTPSGGRVRIARAKGSEPATIVAPVPQQPKPSPSPALGAILILLADGRASEWEAALAELLQKGKSPTSETYHALLAYYAAQPCSPETAATASAILAHQMAASAANPSLIPDSVAFAHVLATFWKDRPDEELSDEAINVLALFARTHTDEEFFKLRYKHRPLATQPLYKALRIVGGESRSPRMAVKLLRSGATDVNRKWVPFELDGASGGSASSAAISGNFVSISAAPVPGSDAVRPEKSDAPETPSCAIDAMNAPVAEGSVAESKATLADLQRKGESPKRETYLALLAHYAAKPCSPESAATARAILAHQIDASTANSSLIPDSEAFAYALATVWKARSDEELSDEALDVLALFARTNESLKFLDLSPNNRPLVTEPLHVALRIVSGNIKSPRKGLELMQSGTKEVTRKWSPGEMKNSPVTDAINTLIATGRVDNWEVTLASHTLQGHSMDAKAYRALLAYYAAQPCSAEAAATARAILAHQIDASATDPSLIPDATAFALVLATSWKNQHNEPLSDEALDVLTLFAKTHANPRELNPKSRRHASGPLFEALRIVGGKSEGAKGGLKIMLSGTKDVRRTWSAEDLAFFARKASALKSSALEAINKLIATGRVDDWEATVADLRRQGRMMTREAYLSLLAANAARLRSPQTAATARALLAHTFTASTTHANIPPGPLAFAHVLATMWKCESAEELSDEALDLLAHFARTHDETKEISFPPGAGELRIALRIVSGESREWREGMRLMREETKEGVKRKWEEEDFAYFARRNEERRRRETAGSYTIPGASTSGAGEQLGGGKATAGDLHASEPRAEGSSRAGEAAASVLGKPVGEDKAGGRTILSSSSKMGRASAASDSDIASFATSCTPVIDPAFAYATATCRNISALGRRPDLRITLYVSRTVAAVSSLARVPWTGPSRELAHQQPARHLSALRAHCVNSSSVKESIPFSTTIFFQACSTLSRSGIRSAIASRNSCRAFSTRVGGGGWRLEWFGVGHGGWVADEDMVVKRGWWKRGGLAARELRMAKEGGLREQRDDGHVQRDNKRRSPISTRMGVKMDEVLKGMELDVQDFRHEIHLDAKFTYPLQLDPTNSFSLLAATARFSIPVSAPLRRLSAGAPAHPVKNMSRWAASACFSEPPSAVPLAALLILNQPLVKEDRLWENGAFSTVIA
ncbi:hypothetical protein BDK51DRAFT_38034 [Blyttiomyces helicus]|uniref:Pentacotripeptide-repeat region of PRORP domain-containing protein n=1 Tax=Blyttiomyces helicus TaxID=388810 RepID=A0A4P9WDR2_9FUNG|nr:hypothetical protein BDK51DRAFT_38034 [Blyttiomyces helicus]|eukprot:RKO89368.1 hypothetical protein BDK51DRAFT_38034 [Blyttiomyces helicus]